MSGRRDGAGRTARRGAREGQVLVLVAVLVPVLIAMLGVVTDTSMIWMGRRSLQNAADAAALAGALDLPNNATAATTARAYAKTNGWDDARTDVEVVVNIPPTKGRHIGKANYIEVIIRHPLPVIFSSVFGRATVDIGAWAVAELQKGFGGIFAMKDTCGGDPGIDWPGSTATVDGSVHSNSEIKVGGQNNKVNGPTTYVCTSGTDLKISAPNTYTPAPAQTAKKPPPVSFTPADFPCTFGSATHSKFDLKPQSGTKTIAPGVYCARDEIILGDSEVTGVVTLVTFGANAIIKLGGSKNTLTPHTKGVLAFAVNSTHADAIKMEGSNNAWTGLLYAPKGRIDMSGSTGSSLTGGMVGWTIKLPGSVWGVKVGDGGKGKARLVE